MNDKHDIDKYIHLSDEDKREIAERIVDIAADRIYGQIGKSVVKKLIWGAIVAAIVAGLMLGVIRLPTT